LPGLLSHARRLRSRRVRLLRHVSCL
jgi:hypothetical protein